MKIRLRLFGLMALFWIAFFEIARGLFLIYHFHLSSQLPVSDILLVLLHGLKMDLSVTGYVLLIPGLLMALPVPNNIFHNFLKYYTAVLLFTYTFLLVTDMELYRHWGFRLDDTPLLYLSNPKEVVGSSNPWMTLALVIGWLALFGISYWVFSRTVLPVSKLVGKGSLKISLVVLLITASLILPIRGSLGQSNMNAGFVYFHKTNTFANHAAINGIWNVQYYLLKSGKAQYDESFFNRDKTTNYFNDLYSDPGVPPKIFQVDRPNVIILALESYTSKIIEPLGGVPGVTPNFNSLTKEGILFSNIFSSGDRTDKGIVSILSGYPAQPRTSIMKFPKKTQSLPYLNQDLKKLGYHTIYTYGYDIDYANFRSYLVNAKFDVVQSDRDFKPQERNSKWGVHDHVVLNRIIDDLDHSPRPFFVCSMTLSSHEPFEVPMDPVFTGEINQQFFNSAYYTDKSIGEFVALAKTKEWWKNTVLILIADHGSRLPNNDPNYAPGKFDIPMLWLGGALNLRDTVITSVGSQTDIPNTLLSQLGVNTDSYQFSKDLLSKDADSFAFYSFNNGFGFVGNDYHLIYDLNARQFIAEEGSVDPINREQSQAYMQKVFWDFNAR
ncbi:MAG: sulfatase [Cyclobacteriaceae bacterium]|nr:MAG: sulfatase [Cyclobacteriaceae bacterium]